MHCKACDAMLESRDELSRRYAESGDFVDLCNHCFSYVADDLRVATSVGELDDDIEEE